MEALRSKHLFYNVLFVSVVQQHIRDCGLQMFIFSRKGGTLLALGGYIYRSNLKRFGPMSNKVYWECIHNRSRKCRGRLKTIDNDLYVTNGIHNHVSDDQRIAFARRTGMWTYKKFSAVGILPKKQSKLKGIYEKQSIIASVQQKHS